MFVNKRDFYYYNKLISLLFIKILTFYLFLIIKKFNNNLFDNKLIYHNDQWSFLYRGLNQMNKEYFIYIIFEKGLDLENINIKSQNIFNLVDYKLNNNIPKNTNSYIDNMKMKLESKFSWSRYHPKNFDINKDQIHFYLYKNYSSLDKFNEIIKDTNKDITHFKAKDVSIYLISNEGELL